VAVAGLVAVAVAVAATRGGVGLLTTLEAAAFLGFEVLSDAGFARGASWPIWATVSLPAMSLRRSTDSRWVFPWRTSALVRQRMTAATDSSNRAPGEEIRPFEYAPRRNTWH
jgi:hypothetical protein